MNVLHELRELDAYLEGMEDIDNNGGPNVAMRVRHVLAKSLPVVDELIEALYLALPYVTDAEMYPEQFKPGTVQRHVKQVRSALANSGGA